MSNHLGYKIPKGLGRLQPNMGLGFVIAHDPKGFVFEPSYSMQHAAREVQRIISTYKTRLDHAKKAWSKSH